MPASDTDPPISELYNTRAGATWVGINTIGPITFQGPGDPVPVAPSTTIVSAILHFHLEGEQKPSLRIGSIADYPAPLTIVNAATWELSIPPIGPDVFLRRAGIYYGDLKITDDEDTVWITHTFKLEVTEAHPKFPPVA